MPLIETAPLILALAAVIGYLTGSIPFGVLLARLFGLGDLRDVGSGNIGATNVLRTGNKLAAFLTLVFDAAKGGVMVLIIRAVVAEDAAQLAGLCAFLGHLYPIYLGFKGGKGIATGAGTLLAVSWPVGLACCLTWLVVAAAGRMSSLASLAAAASAILWAILLNQSHVAVLAGVMVVLVFVAHRENIARLKAGTEPKIGQKP
ncbi:glycerol-3-phosphate 1-O-acyltransferase PlsY [Actibacterium sp. 188UL27-1]|uniref:glycerol-3-phosphate 1-O-acyltransferase PlsY n=1 Tax=Actibacterium sp. 188UL27-1 TaxID=2786961 RepID=UPI00195F0A38|nr:glycerol-3-phosphate 1-O-acyltransferase PlsY [Actibacterium sp. 188UL27-1]MBM7066055.1 glycerol-3-phosphate 1-O-acyltransferase PlsY [Actibacterium sp. 188UL27-1]